MKVSVAVEIRARTKGGCVINRQFSAAAYSSQTQLCETCRNYLGGCSWTEVGKDGRVRFEPVSGWKAEKVRYSGAAGFTYQISECPLYIKE